jgi:hypothetical protein
MPTVRISEEAYSILKHQAKDKDLSKYLSNLLIESPTKVFAQSWLAFLEEAATSNKYDKAKEIIKQIC